MLVSTVTAAPRPAAALPPATLAGRCIISPPSVGGDPAAPYSPRRRAAPSPGLGMSCSLASASTGPIRASAPPARAGPCSNPRPTLNPATTSARDRARRTASSPCAGPGQRLSAVVHGSHAPTRSATRSLDASARSAAVRPLCASRPGLGEVHRAQRHRLRTGQQEFDHVRPRRTPPQPTIGSPGRARRTSITQRRAIGLMERPSSPRSSGEAGRRVSGSIAAPHGVAEHHEVGPASATAAATATMSAEFGESLAPTGRDVRRALPTPPGRRPGGPGRTSPRSRGWGRRGWLPRQQLPSLPSPTPPAELLGVLPTTTPYRHPTRGDGSHSAAQAAMPGFWMPMR